ncbi:hypothetical protein B566_EDAN015274 [Ephemera danica]|nr:hypothetical protein B566_EDAN015274 [Ephemera danica]
MKSESGAALIAKKKKKKKSLPTLVNCNHRSDCLCLLCHAVTGVQLPGECTELKIVIFSWFFSKIGRKEAERLLLAEDNPRGTYLVRGSEHNPSGFSLSVKDWDETRGHHIKHYKIKPLDNGGFYIATTQTFASLQALVQSYTKNALGLCHVLSRPCPHPKPVMWDLSPQLRDRWEIDRNEIKLVKKLGQGNFGEVCV